MRLNGTSFEVFVDLETAIVQNFMIHYSATGSEARALIYRNVETKELKVEFMNENTTPTACIGSPDMFWNNNIDWPLYADLHSHHIMGAYFSATDDEHERVRNIVFGVFSWKDGKCKWVFRYFDGEKFVGVSEQWIKNLGKK